MSEQDEVNEIMNNDGPVEEESNSEVVVEDPEEQPEQAPEEEAPEEEAPEEEAPEEEAPEEEAPEEEAPEEEAPEEEAPEEPVEEAAEEAPVEEVPKEDAPKEDAPEEESITESVSVVTDNLCSLKTLVDVLGKWSGNEIRRRNVEDLLKEDSEVDENLDDLEKVVEVLQLWIGEGGSTFREHNHFKNLDEYTLSSESRNLSEEKKVEVLKTVTDLVVNVSQRRVTNEEIQNVMNNLY